MRACRNVDDTPTNSLGAHGESDAGGRAELNTECTASTVHCQGLLDGPFFLGEKQKL